MFWHPHGALVRHLIESFWKDTHLARGYQLVNTPHIAREHLWRTSGHYDFYKENMFDQMEVRHLAPVALVCSVCGLVSSLAGYSGVALSKLLLQMGLCS